MDFSFGDWHVTIFQPWIWLAALVCVAVVAGVGCGLRRT
jgi:hypothetical protein